MIQMEPMPPAVEAQSPSYWTGEIPVGDYL